jgi:hypothetical protein
VTAPVPSQSVHETSTFAAPLHAGHGIAPDSSHEPAASFRPAHALASASSADIPNAAWMEAASPLTWGIRPPTSDFPSTSAPTKRPRNRAVTGDSTAAGSSTFLSSAGDGAANGRQ